jgi:hypothetical protein
MMPYDSYRLYEIERAKSAYEIQRADRQAALFFSAVSGLFRAIAQARSAVLRIRLPGLLRHAPAPGPEPAMSRRGSRRRHTAQTPAEPAGPRQLLADGAGPLYRRASTEDLGDLIDEATRALTR